MTTSVVCSAHTYPARNGPHHPGILAHLPAHTVVCSHMMCSPCPPAHRFTRGSKSSKHILSAPDDTMMRTWVSVIMDALQAIGSGPRAPMMPVGYPARADQHVAYQAGASPTLPPYAGTVVGVPPQSGPPAGSGYGYPTQAADVPAGGIYPPQTAYPPATAPRSTWPGNPPTEPPAYSVK
jgi:hypothetical protein